MLPPSHVGRAKSAGHRENLHAPGTAPGIDSNSPGRPHNVRISRPRVCSALIRPHWAHERLPGPPRDPVLGVSLSAGFFFLPWILAPEEVLAPILAAHGETIARSPRGSSPALGKVELRRGIEHADLVDR